MVFQHFLIIFFGILEALSQMNSYKLMKPCVLSSTELDTSPDLAPFRMRGALVNSFTTDCTYAQKMSDFTCNPNCTLNSGDVWPSSDGRGFWAPCGTGSVVTCSIEWRKTGEIFDPIRSGWPDEFLLKYQYYIPKLPRVGQFSLTLYEGSREVISFATNDDRGAWEHRTLFAGNRSHLITMAKLTLVKRLGSIPVVDFMKVEKHSIYCTDTKPLNCR